MSAYYNEHDPYCAEWLRRLVLNGHLAPGDVDERDIRDIRPDDLKGYRQCHFFAGIGVWSHALRRAGWPDERPIWTGSCPCQPFSAAGARAGFADERHLWPAFNHLISQCGPATVVGEQVENAGDWLDLVSADLEAQGYAFGAAFLPAAGFGGAHIRSRNYWMAHIFGHGRPKSRHGDNRGHDGPQLDADVCDGRLADDAFSGWQRQGGSRSAQDFGTAELCGTGGLADDDERRERSGAARGWGQGPSHDCAAGRPHAPLLGREPVDWLFCRDGRWRPVEPCTFPLVDAAPARVGRLRAYGNALDAETATQFCAAMKACIDG